MIARVLGRFLDRRIALHDARAKAFAAATVAAQVAGDGVAAGTFHTSMCRAQAQRDDLIATRTRIAGKRTCPPCTHDCDEGRTCPARIPR